MAWYGSSWPYRFKITSDQTKVDEAVDDLLYDLSQAPAAFWSAARSDGGDLRVTQADGATEVAREVSGFNQGSQIGSLFFKADGLSASVDTDFYVYYGNASATEPAAGSTYGKNNVWTSYVCVWHIDEASGTLTCSKSGTSGTNTGGTLGATGKLRTGISFPASASQRIAAGDNFDLTAASLSISAWANPTDLAADHQIVAKLEPAGPRNGYGAYIDTAGRLRLTLADATSAQHAGGTSGTVTAGSLQHLFWTYDGATVRLYRNSSAEPTSAQTIIPTGNANPFSIGNYPTTDFHLYPGVIDEVRISTSVRSQNWITTEYNNQNAPNTFWTTGTQEAMAGVLGLSGIVSQRRPRPFAPGIAR